MLLPLIGAGLGGLQAYQASEGNLGATLLGAGIGAVTPGAMRMAGTALGAKLAGTGLAAKAGAGLTGNALRLSQLAANQAGTLQGGLAASGALNLAKAGRILSSPGLAGRLLPTALGAAAAGGGVLLGAPALAGGLAANVTKPAGTAAQVGAGALGYQTPAEAAYGGDALPPGMGQTGPTDPFGNPIDMLGPAGIGQRLAQFKSAETQRDIMRLLLPEVYKASEARSKSEFARNMAAAGIRQNIATRAAMLQAAQQAGLNMGATAAQQAGGALTSQYQYS